MTTAARRIKTETRRLRRRQLAERYGLRCAYCRRPFATVREATLDHIVPNSLWRTATVTALVLACLDCNHRKGDRFPLSLALLLLRQIDPTRPVIRPTDLPVLARLAYANHPIHTASSRPDSAARRSTRGLPESTPNDPIESERTAA